MGRGEGEGLNSDSLARRASIAREKLQLHYDGEKRLSTEELQECGERVTQAHRAGSETLRSDDPPTPGWPRPWIQPIPSPSLRQSYEHRGEEVPQKLPVPWVGGGDPASGLFASFCEAAMREMRLAGYLLCNVCGEEVEGAKVFLTMGEDSRQSTAGGMHPRCALISLKHCPHFLGLDPDKMILVYRGEGHGMKIKNVLHTAPLELPEGGSELDDFEVTDEAEPLTLAELKDLAKG